MRTGIATVPLDWGRCPPWLFERMKRLSRGIALAVIEEFGPEEFLKRLSDPVWFQSLGCVIAFDWNSSGLATTTLGALKEGLRGLEKELDIFICGGKGKTSRKTPEQIKKWGEFLGFSEKKVNKLVYASKISAKVDSSLIQAGFQIYHHNFIFTKSGSWNVVQQGMNTEIQKARRYHWLSLNLKDFTQEPHTGIVSEVKAKPLNLTAKESKENKKVSTELAREESKGFLRDFARLIEEKPKNPSLFSSAKNSLLRRKRGPHFVELELYSREFYWHPVLKEKFDFKRLKRIIEKIRFFKPETFENLLMIEGVGPKTIRALSLAAELIYGAKASFEDPARYSFAHGGKDGTPYFPDKEEMDKTIRALEQGIKKSKISLKEKIKAREMVIEKFNPQRI